MTLPATQPDRAPQINFFILSLSPLFTKIAHIPARKVPDLLSLVTLPLVPQVRSRVMPTISDDKDDENESIAACDGNCALT